MWLNNSRFNCQHTETHPLASNQQTESNIQALCQLNEAQVHIKTLFRKETLVQKLPCCQFALFYFRLKIEGSAEFHVKERKSLYCPLSKCFISMLNTIWSKYSLLTPNLHILKWIEQLECTANYFCHLNNIVLFQPPWISKIGLEKMQNWVNRREGIYRWGQYFPTGLYIKSKKIIF